MRDRSPNALLTTRHPTAFWPSGSQTTQQLDGARSNEAAAPPLTEWVHVEGGGQRGYIECSLDPDYPTLSKAGAWVKLDDSRVLVGTEAPQVTETSHEYHLRNTSMAQGMEIMD